MVSLRQLENTASVRLVKRDELPWEQIRQDLFFWLLKRDIESGEAEELVDAAIVRIFGTMPDPDHVANPSRIKRDVQQAIGHIRHEQAIEEGWFAESSEEYDIPEDCHASRLSRLTPAKSTVYVNDVIANRRATQILFRWFSRKYWHVDCPAN